MAEMRSTDMRGVLVGKPANMKGMHSPALGGLAIMSGKRNRGKGKMARPVGFAAGGLASTDDSEGDTPEDSSDVGALRAATRKVIAYNQGGGDEGGGGGGGGAEDGGGEGGGGGGTAPAPSGGTLEQMLVQQYRDQMRNMPKASDLAAQEDKIAALQEGALNRQLAQSKSMGSGGINIPLLQASAAMLAPTKAGSFGESLGAAGAAGAGALSQQRQMDMLQADRESKLQESIAKNQSDSLERKRKTYETAQASAAKTLETMSNVAKVAETRLQIAEQNRMSQQMIAMFRVQAQQAAAAAQQAAAEYRTTLSLVGRQNLNMENPLSLGQLPGAAAGMVAAHRGAVPGAMTMPTLGAPGAMTMPTPGAPGAPAPVAAPQPQLQPPPDFTTGGRLGAPPSAPPPLPDASVPSAALPPTQDAPAVAPDMAPAAPPAVAPVDGGRSVRMPMPSAAPLAAPAPEAPPFTGLNLPPDTGVGNMPPLAPLTIPSPSAAPAPVPASKASPDILTQAPRNNVTQKIMTGDATQDRKLAMDDAKAARSTAISESQLNMMEKALRDYDASGRTAGAQAQLKRFFGGLFGFKDPAKVSDYDLFTKIKEQSILQLGKNMSTGATSNLIEKIASRAMPDIDTNSFDGNLKIIDYMHKANKLNLMLGDAAAEWADIPANDRPRYIPYMHKVVVKWAKDNPDPNAPADSGGASLDYLKDLAAGKQ